MNFTKELKVFNEMKMLLVQKNDFEGAAEWRDVERTLERITTVYELYYFIDGFKYQNGQFSTFKYKNEIYEVIKSLDVKRQRTEKIKKIEKLH